MVSLIFDFIEQRLEWDPDEQLCVWQVVADEYYTINTDAATIIEQFLHSWLQRNKLQKVIGCLYTHQQYVSNQN